MEPRTRLGPYEIVSRIGAGGMGEVWRARDTRLDRDVAIKILPAEVAGDAKLKIRFEREAKTISQLEHPNICRLYDVGDGYLVMELLDGESLADRLAKGPLPLREVVKVAVQIADALDRAHRRGIIHRDLKPGNIMLTKSGAKLLDFGLARPATGVNAQAETDVVTAHSPLTGEAVVVGTFAYMSPEQVRAEDLDARSDVFSLGIVLYEMLSGRRPFTARSAVETMNAIVAVDPPPLATDGSVPAGVAQIVQRCLEKDRDDRFQSAGDVGFALASAAQPSSGSIAVAPVTGSIRTRRWIWSGTVAALLLIAGFGAMRLVQSASSRASGKDVTRFQISFPAESPLVSGSVAISPDGRTLAYVRRNGDTEQLYLRSLSSLEDTAIDGSAGATSPFFSPDGKWVAFGADGKLRKLRLADRQVITLADTGDIDGGTWGTDGSIIYASARSGTLFRIADTGGDSREITRLERGETYQSVPQVLPGNRTVLFSTSSGFGTDEARRIGSLDLNTGKRRIILGNTNARWDAAAQIATFRWFAGGYLLFEREGRIYAVHFNPKTATVEGDPIVIVDQVAHVDFASLFAVSDNGTLVYQSPGTGDDSPSRLVRLTAKGSDEPLPFPPGIYFFLALSPDERQLALTVDVDGRGRIATADLARGTISFLSHEGSGHLALWTPDSQRVIYSWTGGGASALVWRHADGSDEAEPLMSSANHQDPASISPDRQWLAYAERDPNTSWDIWLLPLTGPRTPRPFLRTRAAEYSPMISPDGRRIAYVVETPPNAAQVFIDSFPKLSHRIYVADGRNPLWSADGKRLYFSQDRRLLTADVSADGIVARPRIVTDDAVPSGGFGLPPFAAFKDGSLVILRPTTPPALTAVVNWASELESLRRKERK